MNGCSDEGNRSATLAHVRTRTGQDFTGYKHTTVLRRIIVDASRIEHAAARGWVRRRSRDDRPREMLVGLLQRQCEVSCRGVD